MLIVTLDKDVEALQSEIARLKSEAVATAQSLENNNMTILGNNRAIQEIDDRIKQLTESTSDGNDKRREEIKAKLGGLSQYKSDAEICYTAFKLCDFYFAAFRVVISRRSRKIGRQYRGRSA